MIVSQTYPRWGERFTEKELCEALHMKEDLGLQWGAVAQRLGRKESSVRKRMCVYRKGMPDRAPRQGEPFTEGEILKAIRLKDTLGLTWEEVAERLGRKPNSVCVTVHRYRNGTRSFKFSREAFEKRMDVMIAEILAGASQRATARRHGVSLPTLNQCLHRRGWDQETINEAREERLAA